MTFQTGAMFAPAISQHVHCTSTRRLDNVGLLWAQHCRCWLNSKLKLDQHRVYWLVHTEVTNLSSFYLFFISVMNTLTCTGCAVMLYTVKTRYISCRINIPVSITCLFELKTQERAEYKVIQKVDKPNLRSIIEIDTK